VRRERDLHAQAADAAAAAPVVDLHAHPGAFPRAATGELPLAALDEMLPRLMANQPALFYAPGLDPAWDVRILRWLNEVRAQARTGVTAPVEIRDLRVALDEMRLVKDAHEVATMRRAAAITAGAHRRAMRATRPGRVEYEIEAELLHEFRRHGAQAPAYTPIVASGEHACVLHYIRNDGVLKDGELLLIDAGCELDGYAADLTRTFPVGGRFSGPQREIYDLVLAAQIAAIAKIQLRALEARLAKVEIRRLNPIIRERLRSALKEIDLMDLAVRDALTK